MLLKWRNGPKINTTELMITYEDTRIPFIERTTVLGVLIDDHLTFDHHTIKLCKQVNSKIHTIRRSSYLLSLKCRVTLFKLFIQSRFDYCSTLFFHFSNKVNDHRLEKCFERSIKRLLHCNIKSTQLQDQLKLLSPYNIILNPCL